MWEYESKRLAFLFYADEEHVSTEDLGLSLENAVDMQIKPKEVSIAQNQYEVHRMIEPKQFEPNQNECKGISQFHPQRGSRFHKQKNSLLSHYVII